MGLLEEAKSGAVNSGSLTVKVMNSNSRRVEFMNREGFAHDIALLHKERG